MTLQGPQRHASKQSSEQRSRNSAAQSGVDPIQSPPIGKECVMGLFTKDIATMDDLLLHGLKEIYYAENRIVKSLPKLIDKATNRDLSKGLRDHMEETKTQVARLDKAFKKLGQDN